MTKGSITIIDQAPRPGRNITGAAIRKGRKAAAFHCDTDPGATNRYICQAMHREGQDRRAEGRRVFILVNRLFQRRGGDQLDHVPRCRAGRGFRPVMVSDQIQRR